MPVGLAEAASQTKGRYKTDFDKKVRQDFVYEKGDLVYLNFNLPNSSQNAKDQSRKWRARKTGSYLIVEEQPKTVTVEKSGLLDNIIIDRLSIVRQKDKWGLPSLHLSSEQVKNDSKRPAEKDKNNVEYRIEGHKSSKKIPIAEDGTDDTTNKDKYVMDKIVRHTLKNETVLYRVQWYRYSADDDTAKLVEIISSHFIRRK